jgi:hypothetical protein
MPCLKVSGSRSRTNCILTMLLIATLTSACNSFPKPYPGYTRPELFFPTTARISEQLQQQSSASDIGFAVEAIDSSVARGSSSARAQVYDKCDSGRTPNVQASPEATFVSIEKQGPGYLIKLNPAAVPASSASIDVTVQSCQANGLAPADIEKKGYQQTVRIAISPSGSALNVIAPAVMTRSDKDYDVRIFDNCAAGSTPAFSTYPPQVSTTLQRDPGTQWFSTRINASTLQPNANTPYVGDIRLMIRSCAAGNLSEGEARSAGLLKDVTIRVGYQTLRTTFNVWAPEDAAQEFGQAFSQAFIATDVVFENPNSQSVIVYGSSLSARLRFLASVDDVKKVFGKDITAHPSRLEHLKWGNIPANNALDFREFYRPLAFTDILAILTYQQQSDPRQQTIDWLKSTGELLAGGAIFLTARDYLKGVGLFTGILVPELEKRLLWDMVLHVKNLQDRGLKEVEEIPEHGQLRRVVFFPRRALPEFVPPFPMYIAEIRPDEAPVTAVLVTKQAAVQSTPGN